MQKHTRNLLLLTIVILMILNKSNVLAETTAQGNPETLAVTLVIDTSGSMAETDPQKLRETAANIFIDLLSPEDYLGIITFNSKEEVILPMQQVQGAANKNNYKKILSKKLESTGGNTDYLLALNQAGKQLDSVKNGNMRKVIIFLTDGEPDPNLKKNGKAASTNQYMDSLWKTVSNLTLHKYPVYSIGFSNKIDPTILTRISTSTQGKVKISENSEELALSFFQILGDLKNRQGFLNQQIQIQGNKSIEFNLDEYTSQATMVFTNPSGKPYEVTVTPPDGKSQDLIRISKSENYSIVTINQENQKLLGKWKVNLTGSEKMGAFGNKDSYIKSWLVSPEPGSLHPTNEPLEISVQVTGETQKGITVEALLSKDGVKDKTPVTLFLKNGVYTGTYNKTDKTGKYDIETRLLQDGKVISTNQASITLRTLPVISIDYWEKDAKFRIGQTSTIGSSLNMSGNKIGKSKELQIENYNLLLNYNNSGTETIPLLDNGLAVAGDIQANDGIWSNKVAYKKQDQGKAFVIVNGTYKGEKFLLEKSLGDFTIYPPGKISVKPLDDKIYSTSNRQLKVPLTIKNTSNFTETIDVSIDKSVGVLQQSKITVKPLTTSKIDLLVNLNKDLEKKVYQIPVKITTDGPLVVLESKEFKLNFELLSKTSYILRYLKEQMVFGLMVIGVILLIPLFIVLAGLLFYRLVVYKNTIITGKLFYTKEGTGSETKKAFEFSKLKQEKIMITFNEDNMSAQYHIFNNEYNYDIVFYVVREKAKWNFLDGWKALLRKGKPTEIMLKTTEPGIFIYEGKVYTKKKIYSSDKFTSGGYSFEYLIDNNSPKDKQKGKNILEGIS